MGFNNYTGIRPEFTNLNDVDFHAAMKFFVSKPFLKQFFAVANISNSTVTYDIFSQNLDSNLDIRFNADKFYIRQLTDSVVQYSKELKLADKKGFSQVQILPVVQNNLLKYQLGMSNEILFKKLNL